MHEMTELDKIYQPILQGAGLTGEDYSGLFLLQFCHCVLSHQRRSLDELQKRQNELLETLSRVNENITSSFLENIARKSFEFDRLHHETIAIISVTEGLLDVMSVSENLKESKKLQRLAVELKRICHDLGLATSTLAPRLEERLKFVEISRNIRESSSLWLLSLMAGIFLPLSLASSLLSMQTRLSDLHYLLYDFCGVIAIFGTLTVVCVRLIRLFASYKGNVHDVFHVHTGIHWAFILPEWMVVLSSFLVGMIKDEGLGLRILGFGTASAIGAFFLIAAVRVFIHYWKKREEITLRAAFVQVITGNQGSTDPTLG
ncbi:hypothetical protein CC80DRAFT_327190 [Byssothecium circinans]|uniref:Uncharacterized protein n=1 Tax=Byssothecium circinans TaxID=147558 RepID=A0A6A5U999_9PLEO|nr:hypothetical protein CC80DRAFT_327190 [Byssothecium circinans]